MDLSKIKDLKDLQALMELMGRHGIVELELEGEGNSLRLRKADGGAGREIVGLPMMGAGMMMPTAATPVAAAPAAGAAGAAPGIPANWKEVKSPMVGSFYRASSPEAEPFAKEGDSVTAEQILCIIEAMKVMNEIPAGLAGIVREVLVKNGESVEFGQPLFRIEVS